MLHLRFVLELSQGQIAQEFGVSQMQISRLLKQLLDRLGRRLPNRERLVDEQVRCNSKWSRLAPSWRGREAAPGQGPVFLIVSGAAAHNGAINAQDHE